MTAAMILSVFMNDRLVGDLGYDNRTNQFDFTYAPSWIAVGDAFPLSPALPLRPLERTATAQNSAVRTFFENLLPEGKALDEAALNYSISKSSVAGLLAVLGRETAGALRIVLPGAAPAELPEQAMRPLPLEELSSRIKDRASSPFGIWDKRVRTSITGCQDKLAVYQDPAGQWFLVNAPHLASTHILKPEPLNPRLTGLTSNEFFCMRLARAAGLNVAPVQLHPIPEPLLLVTRFDRKASEDTVQRLPAIDGCQALGLAVGFKYERPYGDSHDGRHIREGASLKRLFELLGSAARPAAERMALLRWVIFQVLIGNTDAHAKNITFFCHPGGLSLAPAYDMACGLLYADDQLDSSYAMAIGDAFLPSELSAYEWASFCHATKLNPKLVKRELTNLSLKVLGVLSQVKSESVAEGANIKVVDRIESIIRGECQRQFEMALAVRPTMTGHYVQSATSPDKTAILFLRGVSLSELHGHTKQPKPTGSLPTMPRPA